MCRIMKCRICGANLKKDGDICKVCYKELQEEEELKQDNVVKLCINRKYSIAYEIAKYLELLTIFLLACCMCIVAKKFLEAIGVVFIAFVVIGMCLAYSKRASVGTKLVFYEKKVIYTKKYLFFDVEKTIKYTDIKDASYFQTIRQKKFKLADLCIYTKGIVPGFGYINGCHISNVSNIEEVFKQIKEIIGQIEE